jgi:cytochrome b561
MMTCPHCSATNPPNSSFCVSCGKALPSVDDVGPRLVTGAATAVSRTGRSLQVDQLAKQCRKAYGTLLAVGILQAVFGTVIVFGMVRSGGPTPPTGQLEGEAAPVGVLVASVYGIAVVFCGLAFWARRSPLPAAVVGLVVYITVHLLDAVADPTALLRGILMKAIIVLVLAKAISAGARHRALSRALAEGG